MHVLTYVLQMPGVSGEAVEEEAILNELRLADYVTELPVQGSHFKSLTVVMESHFGKENLAADEDARTITITKSGVVRYFAWLRARIKCAIDSAMGKPIEDFIHLRGESDWYAIKTIVDDPFATQFYMDGYGCGPVTVFAHHLYVQMGYEQADSVTLKLTQVFDVHY